MIPFEAYVLGAGLLVMVVVGVWSGWRAAVHQKKLLSKNATPVVGVSRRGRYDVHQCEFGHYRGISPWCPVCTAERELRSKKFQYNCACPQCGLVDTHDWVDLSTMQYKSPYMNVDDSPNTVYVVRHCNYCGFRWRQS